MSNNGFQTPVWGPPAWFFLHTITFNFPLKPTKQDKKNYFTLFKNLEHTLPCRACRESYSYFLNNGNTRLTMKILNSRYTLSFWLYRLHNKINKKIGKPITVTYKYVQDFYEKVRAKCNKNTHTGCTQPTQGIKKRAFVTIVPRNCNKKHSIQLHSKCKK